MPLFAQFQEKKQQNTSPHSSIYCYLLSSDIQWELHCSLTKLLQQISKQTCINIYTIMFLENSFPTQNLLSNTKTEKSKL